MVDQRTLDSVSPGSSPGSPANTFMQTFRNVPARSSPLMIGGDGNLLY